MCGVLLLKIRFRRLDLEQTLTGLIWGKSFTQQIQGFPVSFSFQWYISFGNQSWNNEEHPFEDMLFAIRSGISGCHGWLGTQWLYTQWLYQTQWHTLIISGICWCPIGVPSKGDFHLIHDLKTPWKCLEEPSDLSRASAIYLSFPRAAIEPIEPMESHRFRFQVSRLPSDQALGQTNIWLQQCACLCSFMFIVLARLSHQRMSKFGNVEEIILKALRLLRSASEAHKECSTKPRSCVFCINVASWFVSIPSHWALSTHDMTWYPTNVERISIFQSQWHHNPSTISSSFKHSQIDARCVAILSVSLMGCPEWANRFAAGWSHPVFCLATAAVQAPHRQDQNRPICDGLQW